MPPVRDAVDTLPATVCSADVCWHEKGWDLSLRQWDRAVVTTPAPLNRKRRTIASPIPLVPPVTRTRLLLNSSLETANGYVCVIEPNLQRGNLRIDLLRYSDMRLAQY